MPVLETPNQYQLIETGLQEIHSNGTTQCNLCLWRCKLTHGQRGFCQAHVNRHGKLYNLSYGILSAIDIGPIEDKPVKHYRPGTQVMSVGSYGCNFRCGGCHNLEISWGVSALDELAKGQSTAAFVSPEELIKAALSHGVDGIAFTYSEPAVWLEYVVDVSILARKAGLYTVYVSNSFITDEALEIMAPHVDVLCSDIKSMRDEFYKDICPVAKVEQVLSCIEKAKHITKFFPAYKLADVPATPTAVLHEAAEIGRRAGLQNVYLYDDKGCDCAETNLPVEAYLDNDANSLHEIKKCAASCCGEDGILLKKYEP
jgi:pyruvate formate lyase activating enzyme